MEYLIRRAIPKDAPQLARLAQAGFPGYPFVGVYDPQSVAEGIATGEHRLVAEVLSEQQLKIVATLVLGADGAMAEVKRVVIDPEYRKNGIAKALTIAVTNEAKESQLHPWADARADQPGMQLAAVRSGMTAVCIEPGKHVVYEHHHPSGPARESMVHMTSLPINLGQLRQQVDAVSLKLQNFKSNLVASLKGAFTPAAKTDQVHELLPSAHQVRLSVSENAQAKNLLEPKASPQDINVLNRPEGTLVVIPPDKSAFLVSINSDAHFSDLPRLVEDLGLQVLTTYANLSDVSVLDKLTQTGFIPTIVRPWTNHFDQPPVWQVGMRTTHNGYENCLHSVLLGNDIKSQIASTIDSLS